MKKFFLLRAASTANVSIPINIVIKYRDAVIFEMKRMGATQQEIALLRDEIIINSITRERKPEDVAWAILQ